MSEFTAQQGMEKIQELVALNEKLHEIMGKRIGIRGQIQVLNEQAVLLRIRMRKNEELENLMHKLEKTEAQVLSLREKDVDLQLMEQGIAHSFQAKSFELSVQCHMPSNAANQNAGLTENTLDCLALHGRFDYLNLEAYQELTRRATAEREQREISDALPATPVQPSAVKKSFDYLVRFVRRNKSDKIASILPPAPPPAPKKSRRI